MKKIICIVTAVVMIMMLAACGGNKDTGWSREGGFKDTNGNQITITKVTEGKETGYQVTCELDTGTYEGTIAEEGVLITGYVYRTGDNAKRTATIRTEGDTGVLLILDDDQYHLVP